jgi:Flp pilus assembly protein TadD
VTEQRRTWRRRTTSADIEVRQEAERRMQRLDDAERTLLDPVRRRAYDTTGTPGAGGAQPAREPWLVRALEQLDKEQFEVATFTARRAVEDDPDNAFAWSVLAEAEARTENATAARDAIERALSLRPEDAKLHAMRGWILGKAKDLPRAVSAYRSAAKLEPGQPDHRVRAVRALIEAGSLDEAISEAEAAYQAHPDDAETRTVLAEALLHRAVEAQHELQGGRLLIVSAAQASHVESLCNRGLSVECPDPVVNGDLRRQRELARKAGSRRFSMAALRRNFRWPAGMGLITLAVGCCAFGQRGSSVELTFLAVAGAVLVAFAGTVLLTCFEPQYKRNAETIEHTVPRRRGRGPGEPDRPH